MEIVGQKKGLVMTVLVFVLFILMIAELLTFVILSSGYNGIAQAIAISDTSNNYLRVLTVSSSQFAQASLSRAITTLAAYEARPSLRTNNFITNTSVYLSYLMVNALPPNVTAGSASAQILAQYMGNLILKNYNGSVANVIGLSAQSVNISETTPLIYQASPYSVSVSYKERVAINSTGGRYSYVIPVNATVPLNLTPDLFYAQQGVNKQIRFASISNLSSVIGSTSAVLGNSVRFNYGTVWNVPAGVACATLTLGGNVPVQLTNAPINKSIILVSSDLSGITADSCKAADKYGGVITYTVGNALNPTNTAWLQYVSGSGEVPLLKNGEQVLLYGPGKEVLNIQNLINATNNGYYFASPYTTSYLDEASGMFTRQSPNGIFTFSNYNTQAGLFDGIMANVVLPIIGPESTTGPLPANNPSLSVWIETNTPAAAANAVFSVQSFYGSGSNSWSFDILNGNAVISTRAGTGTFDSFIPVNDGRWHHIVGELVAPQISGSSPNYYIYVDGKFARNSLFGGTAAWSGNDVIGAICTSVSPSNCGNFYKGSIANLQLYNTTLTNTQVVRLYQEGITGVPISNSGLMGWYQLNGNANDYSGGGNNPTSGTLPSYNLIANYSRDSIMVRTVPGKISQIPGVLSCRYIAQCTNSSLPHLYMGNLPLENMQSNPQVSNFNGQNSIFTAVNSPTLGNAVINGGLTVSAWVYPTTTGIQEFVAKNNNGNNGFGPFGLAEFTTSGSANVINFTMSIGGLPSNLISNNAITLDTWHNVIGTWNGVTMLTYIDGVQDSNSMAQSSAGTTSSGKLSIGGYASYTKMFNGNMLNIQIYNWSIGANMIQQLYQEGAYGLPVTTNGLVAWYPLENNANDISGNNNNGIAMNVTYPYFSGNYNAPGISTVTHASNEWQAMGLANT